MSKHTITSDKNISQNWPVLSILSNFDRHVLAGAAIIAVVTFVIYFPSLSGGFILDDDIYVTDSPIIKSPDGLYLFWFTFNPIDYYPISNSILWIEWRLWGMNPTGYHVINLILHIIESLLIWLILRKLALPGALLAALIFAVHPINAESVAWIAQCKGMLAMLFFLLSIFWYLKVDIESPPEQYLLYQPGLGRWYWLSIFTFILGMLSKGSIAVLPVMLLGIVWWRRKITWRDMVRALPFFLLAGGLTWLNVWFQTHGTEPAIRTTSFTERLLGACGAVWFYLYKALLPLNLEFVYPQWHIQVDRLLWWLPLFCVLGVTSLLWWYRKKWSRPFLFAWGFFCIALIPALGFTDVGFMKYSLVADHYQHIAIIGVIALVAAGWYTWHRKSSRVACSIGVVMVCTLLFLTWRQSGLYRGPITLYQATLEKNPESWLCHVNLSLALIEVGQFKEAIKHCEEAIRIKSDYFEAYYNLGVDYDKLGRPKEAIEYYQEALRIKPNDFKTHNNLGIILAATGRLVEAIAHYQKALQIKPRSPEIYNNLGLALANSGRLPEAIEQYKKALMLKHDDPEAYTNLGNALSDINRFPEAIECFRQALNLKSDDPEIHVNLGIALRDSDQIQEAISHFEQALRLMPNLAEAYANMAMAYAKANQSSQAISMAQKAINLAQSKGQMDLAKHMEDWLNSYRASL